MADDRRRWPMQSLGQVIFVFVGMAACGGTTGLLSMKKGAEWSDFLPQGSYVVDFYNARDKWFGDHSFGSVKLKWCKD